MSLAFLYIHLANLVASLWLYGRTQSKQIETDSEIDVHGKNA